MSLHLLAPFVRRVALVAGALVAVAALSACAAGFEPQTSASLEPAGANNHPDLGGTSAIAIRGAFILGPAPGEGPYSKGSAAAVYLTVVNQTAKADTLVAASSPVASKVIIAASGGDSTIDVPPTGQNTSPVSVGQPPYADDSLTLSGLTQDLRNTEIVPLTLRFRRAGEVSLDVPVMPREGAYATLSPAPSSTPGATPTGATASVTPSTASPTPAAG